MPNDQHFIGRKRILAELEDDIFRAPVDEPGHCISLVGPNGIGKTSLIDYLAVRLADDPIPNVYYIVVNVESGKTIFQFWRKVIRRIKEVIPESALRYAPNPIETHISTVLQIYTDFERPVTDKNDADAWASESIELLFQTYKELRIRVILAIDEMDKAKTTYTTPAFYDILYNLSIKSRPRLFLSLILISRRHLSTIAVCSGGSNLCDGFQQKSLTGFNNRELELYFKLYEKLSCGALPEKTRQQILNVCGRSPQLLMEMYERIRKELRYEGGFDVTEIRQRDGSFLSEYYVKMCNLMKEESIPGDKTRHYISTFIQYFIGPAYSGTLSEDMETLYQHGFVTKAERGYDIFSLAGLCDPLEVDRSIYEPIAPKFVEHIKNLAIVEFENELFALLAKAELNLRVILTKELSALYPDDWKERLEAKFPKKRKYLENLVEDAKVNLFDLDSPVVSMLSVLSFNEYFQLIEENWGSMQKYFVRYDSLKELEGICEKFATYRNSKAHHNTVVLNRGSKEAAHAECVRLLESMECNPDDPYDERYKFDPKKPDKNLHRLVNLKPTNKGGLNGNISRTALAIKISSGVLTGAGIDSTQGNPQTLTARQLKWHKDDCYFEVKALVDQNQ